jgi:PST family polysaccharide transporter
LILDIFKKISQNQLFKVTSLSSFSILIRLITGFLSSKVIAYFVGPSGMALMGNLRSFTSLLESVGTLGIQNGVLQNVAKNHQDRVKLNHFVRLIFWTLLFFSLLISTVLIFGNSYFGKMIFNRQSEYNFILNFVLLIINIPKKAKIV